MIANLIVINSQWVWHIGISAFIIWAVFIWKEWPRLGKPKFFVNLIISLIAMISLTLILLKPLSSNSKKQENIALLTTGYRTMQLDSLNKIHKKLKVYNYDENLPILKTGDAPDSIFILGRGLRIFDLWQLDAIEVKYLGGEVLNGISDLKYKTNNAVGAKAQFNGRYLNATSGHQLILTAPGGEPLDSIKLLSKEAQEFQLATALKVEGKFLYELVEKDSLGNTISIDPLPLNVIKQSELKIIIINDFPTFETKYLKNYLAEKGHQVLVRSQITKERFKFEYFNMANKPMVDFSQENLAVFDLIIIDAISLRKLSGRKRRSLEKAIRENGLGIFIQPDLGYYTSPNSLFSFDFIRDKNNITTLEEWPNTKVTTHEYYFISDFSQQAIFKNDVKTLSVYKRAGIGKVGTSVFQNTYQLLLNGHSEAYQKLWAKTIEKLSKIENPFVEWDTNMLFAFKNEPFNFQLRTTETKPSVSSDEGYNIPLRQDIDIASLWKGTTYPRNIGWKKQVLQQDTTTVFEYYVTAAPHWRSLIANNTIAVNQRQFNNRSLKNHNLSKSMKPVNPIWFYLIFIISMGYLWLEPKL